MNKLFIPFLFLILTFSCKSSNDPEVVYADWNLKNKQYFNQMKDSTDYVLYNTPSTLGGYSFYYKILSLLLIIYHNIPECLSQSVSSTIAQYLSY